MNKNTKDPIEKNDRWINENILCKENIKAFGGRMYTYDWGNN